MILVQNHRLPLNGSKILAVILLMGMLFGACAPKILRPGGGKGPKSPSKKTEEAEKKEDVKTGAKKEISFNNIALLLPFQLDKVVDSLPNKRDVERSSLALDFYQGFKLGLDMLAKEGDNFKLHVLDTKDNTGEVQKLAVGKDIADAQLVIGPIFPTEINAFSSSADLKGKLQISPLAASNPSRYQIDNLVTVTPPIEVHAQVISKYIADKFGADGKVIIVSTNDEDSRKFIDPLKTALDALDVHYTEVTELSDIEANLAVTGKNLVISGSANQYFLSPLIADLYRLKTEQAYDLSLIGHPNWSKLDFNAEYLKALNTCISSSYFISEANDDVRKFRVNYFDLYKVIPSEFAFKGFDTGVFFGRLLARHPEDYVSRVAKEKHNGLSIGFDFKQNPNAGYVNNFVRLLHFNGTTYKPL